MLTRDAADARRTLAESGATTALDVDPVELLDEQFGGLAYLTTGP